MVGVKLGQPATGEGRLGGGAEAQNNRSKFYAYYGRMTVRVTGTPLLQPPEDAVTVTVDVPAGVPVVAPPLEVICRAVECLA